VSVGTPADDILKMMDFVLARCSSFADGLTPDELARVTSEVEASFDTPTSPALAPGVPPPLALQALWCFLGGQELEFDGDEELSSSLFWGALGGYSFYNNTVSMRMLPIRKAVAGTAALHQVGTPSLTV
jgi:hypothetical protein